MANFYGKFLGTALVIIGIIFILRPKTIFTTNPAKDIQKLKKYDESFTPKKALLMRFLYSLVLIYGLYVVYTSI